MKTVVNLFFIFFFVAVSVQAKQGQQSEVKPLTADEIVAKLKVQLELTDKQVDQVTPIIADFLAKEEQVRLEEKQALAKVLTGEQMYSWNDLQKQQQKEKKKHAKHDAKAKPAGPVKNTAPAPPAQ